MSHEDTSAQPSDDGEVEDELVQYADDGRMIVCVEGDDDAFRASSRRKTAEEAELPSKAGKRKRVGEAHGEVIVHRNKNRNAKDGNPKKKHRSSKLEPFEYIAPATRV